MTDIFDPMICWGAITDDKAKWVVYRNGTCISVDRSVDDPAEEANKIMKEFGPVHVASPAADFGVWPAPCPGWIVTSHHCNLSTFVAPNEVSTDYPSGGGLLSKIKKAMMGQRKAKAEILIGLYGRQKRVEDAEEMEIVAIHDPRESKNGT